MSLPQDSLQLQRDLDAAPPGSMLELGPREYRGPLVLRGDITVDGHGATFWAPTGPVLIVESTAVARLKNLGVEVTGEDAALSPQQETAIQVAPGGQLEMEEVQVRGGIEGLPMEGGLWRYPKTVYLGCLQPQTEHTFKLRMIVGSACRITSQVSGIAIEPTTLPHGPVEVMLRLEKMRNDTFLHGRILLSTAFSKRWLMLCGHVLSPPERGAVPVHTLLWEPDDWAAVGPSTPVASPAPIPGPTAPQFSTRPAQPTTTTIPNQLSSALVSPLTSSPAAAVAPTSSPAAPRPPALKAQDPIKLGIFAKPPPKSASAVAGEPPVPASPAVDLPTPTVSLPPSVRKDSSVLGAAFTKPASSASQPAFPLLTQPNPPATPQNPPPEANLPKKKTTLLGAAFIPQKKTDEATPTNKDQNMNS